MHRKYRIKAIMWTAALLGLGAAMVGCPPEEELLDMLESGQIESLEDLMDDEGGMFMP